MTPHRAVQTEHPVALGSFLSWMQATRQGGGIDWHFLPKYLFVSLCTLLTGPLRGWESLLYRAGKKAAPIHPAPIFIVGHWRSGTTHLHNLLAQDANLCFLSTFQAMAPGFCLSGERVIKPILSRIANRRYPTRLIDNVPLAFDAPQEDEFAMACLSHRAFIHGFSFPRRAEQFLERYVLLDQQPQEARARWMEQYLALLRTMSLQSDGRRPVLKNCANTGRIRTLLECFPDARFIHIHRNPYDVYLSTMHMHRTVLPRSQLQHTSADRIEERVLHFYEIVMRHVLAVRSTLAPNQYLEVRFDDLERAPLEQLEQIYTQLRLPGFPDARPRFASYMETVAEYRKNTYPLEASAVETVNRRWGFAFDALGYERLQPSEVE